MKEEEKTWEEEEKEERKDRGREEGNKTSRKKKGEREGNRGKESREKEPHLLILSYTSFKKPSDIYLGNAFTFITGLGREEEGGREGKEKGGGEKVGR